MLGLSPKAKSQCRKPYLSEELESLQRAGTCSVMAAPALGAPSPCYFCDRHFTEAHPRLHHQCQDLGVTGDSMC